jgi:hypothetical protein
MTQKLREQLIGAWKLVSYEERPVDGSPPFYPMTEQPMGIIMYTPDAGCFLPIIAVRSFEPIP